MWRFLLPALTTMVALVVLFASARGDVRSLPLLPGQVFALVKSDGRDQHKPENASLAAASPATAQQHAVLEGLQRQVGEFQRQSAEIQDQLTRRSQELEQRTHEAAAARADAEKLQASVVSLRQQNASLTDALARQKQAVAMARTTASRFAAGDPRPADSRPGQPICRGSQGCDPLAGHRRQRPGDAGDRPRGSRCTRW